MDAVQPAQKPNLFDVVSRRRLVVAITFVVALVLAPLLIKMLPQSYVASARVLLVNDSQGRDPSTEGSDLPSLVLSSAVLEPVLRRDNIPASLADFRKSVSAHVAPRSSLMTISFKDPSAARAVQVPGDIADSFVSFYRNLTTSRYEPITSRLRRDLAKQHDVVTKLEHELQVSAATSMYGGSDQSLDSATRRIGDLETQHSLAVAQYQSDQAQLAAQRNRPSAVQNIVKHERLESSPAYRDLQATTATDETALIRQHAMYTEAYPGLPGLVDQVNREHAALGDVRSKTLSGEDSYSQTDATQTVDTQRAAATVAGDQARIKALESQVASATSTLRDTSTPTQSVGALRATRDAAEAQYQALALRLSNAQANSAEAASLGAVNVVDRPVSAERGLASARLLTIIALLLVLGLAIGAAYIAEALDPRLYTDNDITSRYGKPVIATLGAK